MMENERTENVFGNVPDVTNKRKGKSAKRHKSKKAKSSKAKSIKDDNTERDYTDEDYFSTFGEIDIDKDGLIHHDEAERAIVQWGLKVEKNDFEEEWGSIDETGDGLVSINEFQTSGYFVKALKSKDCSFTPTKPSTNPIGNTINFFVSLSIEFTKIYASTTFLGKYGAQFLKDVLKEIVPKFKDPDSTKATLNDFIDYVEDQLRQIKDQIITETYTQVYNWGYIQMQTRLGLLERYGEEAERLYNLFPVQFTADTMPQASEIELWTANEQADFRDWSVAVDYINSNFESARKACNDLLGFMSQSSTRSHDLIQSVMTHLVVTGGTW